MIPKATRKSAIRGLGALLLATAAAPVFASGTVKVDLNEWDVGIDADSVGPGKVTFAVNNAGRYTHAFELERNGEEIVRTDSLSSGDSTEVAVELSEGRYEVYCPIDGHTDSGMEAKIQVTADGLRVITSESA